MTTEVLWKCFNCWQKMIISWHLSKLTLILQHQNVSRCHDQSVDYRSVQICSNLCKIVRDIRRFVRAIVGNVVKTCQIDWNFSNSAEISHDAAISPSFTPESSNLCKIVRWFCYRKLSPNAVISPLIKKVFENCKNEHICDDFRILHEFSNFENCYSGLIQKYWIVSYCACVFVDLCLGEKMIFFQEKLMKPESEFILRECRASRNSATHLPNISEFLYMLSITQNRFWHSRSKIASVDLVPQ